MKLDLEHDDLIAFLTEASRLAAGRFLDTGRDALHPARPLAEIRDRFEGPLPEDPLPWAELLAKVRDEVYAGSARTTSPDFYSLVTTAGNPFGIAAELLAAGVNQVVARENVAPAATAVESQVLGWIADFIGYPQREGGVLVSGGSAANLVALKAALAARGPEGVARRGLAGAPPITVYTSTQGHLCLDKAVDLLGFGRDQLRKIEVDPSDFRIRLELLREAIRADRADGAHPLAVVAQGGGVNTGVIDDLHALADLCAEEGMWLHVDGAYGAPAAATEAAGELFAGLERADSLAIDAHKWFYVPFTAGCVLVQDPTILRRAFSVMADYAESSLEDVESVNFMERGIQMSRGFSALKVWMTLLGYGARTLRAAIDENIRTMRHFGGLLDAAPDFERLNPVTLSVVLFRYLGAGLEPGRDDAELDALNEALFRRLEADGRVGVGRVRINGNVALRACNVKYRSERAHVEHLLQVVRETGREVTAARGVRA